MEIKWLPSLFGSDGNQRVIVGFDEQSNWWMKCEKDGVATIEALPIIEKNIGKVGLWWPYLVMFHGGDFLELVDMLQSRLKEIGFNEGLANSFPFFELALHSIHHEKLLSYSGLEWICDLPTGKLDGDLAYKLFLYSQDNSIPQELRHKLSASVHGWEEVNEYAFIKYRVAGGE